MKASGQPRCAQFLHGGVPAMKELSPGDRPREKMLAHGARALGDNELVAAVIGSGCQGRDALVVANELLAARGGLHGLVQACCDDLAQVAGIGPARAAQLVAAVELGRRTLSHRPRARLQLQTPQQAAAYLMPAYGGRAVEQFGVVLLDVKHRIIRTAVLAVGTLNSAGVEPRDVFREASRAGAAALIAFHNPPSGDPTPSADDVELTGRLVAAGVLMGIDVVDHIVLGDVRYCSLKQTAQM
jgi:DNA repair protein RadC